MRCHTEKKDLQTVLIASSGKCQNCHEGDNPISAPVSRKQGALHKVSTRLDKTKQKIVQKRKDNFGMRFPMYTGRSRLGDKPNEMIKIPAGEFIMGTDARLPDEGPQYIVNLPAYTIDVYEVTNLQYKKFNDATNGRSPLHWRNRTFPQGKADHPVVFVTWDNANEYCHWAGKRLPTDQEWEKAARGADGRIFPWGDEFNTFKANTPLRWQEIGAIGDTTPVGSFKEGKSPYGLYDMSGNVWEWTDSWYKAYPGNKTESESYGERYKTLKGGSWFDCSFYKCGISAPVFNRAFFAKKVKNDSFGFRCADAAAAGVTTPGPTTLE
jgi:formylglycine-generating enzyme required for sulfatase activity